MIALDTDVLARAFLDDDKAQSPLAQRFLEQLTAEERGFVSLTVTVELYWVMVRTRRLPIPEVLAMFDTMMETDVFEIEDGESVGEALEVARRGADFPEALIHSTARLHGIEETVTFDRHAAETLGWRLLA